MTTNDTASTVYLSVGFDLSNYTDIDLTFIKPDGDELIVTPLLGGADVTVEGRDLFANKYVTHTFAVGDIDQAGDWECFLSYDERARAPHAARYLITPLEVLTVQEISV